MSPPPRPILSLVPFRTWALLLLAALGTPPCRGAEDVPRGHYAFRSYGTEQGLGNLAPSHLLQDRQGYIWVGTEDGLYRYDGQRFQVYDRRNGLPSTFITSIHEDGQGRLWVGTYQGLARLEGRKFQVVEESTGLPRLPVDGIASDQSNQVWAATPKGLFVTRNGSIFSPAPNWPGGEASAVYCRPGSLRVWAGAWSETGGTRQALIHEWHAGTWKTHHPASGSWTERVDGFQENAQGWVFARTRRGLWAQPPGGAAFHPVAVPFPLGISARAALGTDRDGTLLVPTDSGVLSMENGTWQRLGLKEGLPVEWARDVIEDREGSTWVASLGVHRLLGRGAWQSHTPKEGLPSEVVWTIFRDREQRLWAGTDKGLARATSRGWETLPATRGHVVRTIVQGPDGMLYTGGSPVEVLRVEPRSGKVERFAQESGLYAKRIFRLALDARGVLWVGTDGGGLYTAQTGAPKLRFESVILPGGGSKEYISGLFLDREGRLWASGEGGLACLEGGQWRRFTEKDGLRQRHVAYTLVKQNGDIYIAYFEATGLTRARLEGGRLRILSHTDEDGSVGSQKVYMMGEDARGRLWIGTGTGVIVMDEKVEEHFGSTDGMAGEDINNMAFLAEANGDVWVGTSSGLARFDARAWTGIHDPPPTVILSMKLGDRSWDGTPSETPRVPHASNTFEARFASLSFVRETAIQYQTRLVGVEPEWHSTETREVRFPALPPGAYRFEVRSRIGQGEWGQPTSLDFRIRPAWWQTWWFRALGILGAVGLGALGVRWRIQALRRQNRHLEEMVAARTQELKAANEALQNQSLTDPLTGLRNRRYLGVCMPEDVAQAVRTRRNISRGQELRTSTNVDLIFLMVDIDHFKSVNDQFGHHAGDMVLQQVADILRRATRETDTVVRWGGEEFLIVARNASRQDSTVLAERVRGMVEAQDFDIGGDRPIRRTCSVGYAFYPFLVDPPDAFSWEQVVDLADHCLYASKRGGRNAWVGISPAEDFASQEVPQRISLEVKKLVDSGRLVVKTSLPPEVSLDWDLNA